MEFRPSRFQILPPVIKNLIIINILCYLAQMTIGTGINSAISIDDTFALHAWQSDLFKPWQLVTHLFMHSTSDFSHILFNMLALWMFGAVLENVWGSKRFLTFYLVCGLGAALIHLLALSYEFLPMIRDYTAVLQEHNTPGSGATALMNFIQKYPVIKPEYQQEVLQGIRMNASSSEYTYNVVEAVIGYHDRSVSGSTVGASGAIFGILAAFGYLFPNTYIYLYMLIPVKAKWFVLFYGAFELYQGIKNSAGDNVAHWAHLGGAVVGLIIVITWNKGKRHFY